MNHIEFGASGEDIAVDHLRKNGYSVIERNYHWRKAEVDVFCQKGNLLIAVEVKTRFSNTWGEPYRAVSLAKQKQIISVTNAFMQQKKIDLEVRFDILSIISNSYQQSVEHIENAFIPRW